ncbi:MAG: hypothetical protein ACRD5I_00860 [Candidatus Acidiferrales bacterium]
MPNALDSGLWSVELPSGWTGHAGQECATFQANPPLGALQISSARKDSAPVSDKHLKEFASERLPPGVLLKEAGYGSFSGFSAEYAKEDRFWKEWWLKSGQLMVYVTYNVVQEMKDSERDSVERILASLKG